MFQAILTRTMGVPPQEAEQVVAFRTLARCVPTVGCGAEIRAPTAQDGDDTTAAREKYEEAKDIVNGIYAKGPHRKWAKAIRQHQLRESYFDDSAEVFKIAKYPGGTPGIAAAVGVPGDEKTDRDDILEKLLARLDKIEAFVKTQRMVYQTAADNGMEAFTAAVEQHSTPAAVRAGATVGGVDVSAYGFAVEESDEATTPRTRGWTCKRSCGSFAAK
ncbi:hypothetical protein CYMTET_50528 [Cymbomonas tetramitiformis]|uniref:Uncharacterized protein n=1 Tax=Cymbomonas tetramitiformis TaxID=36881 RepID=A0AAE0BP83_9CHLO|nr:hypothetical protein CYMTET_50528 [Cymbomonas tetramitiformis]